jgi:hypothetical protein
MSKPHLLMIGGWTDTLVKAFDAGFEVSYLGPCQSSDAFDAVLLEKCHFVREVKIDQIGVCLALVRELHAQAPFTAIVSFTEIGMETAAVLSNALNVKGLDLWAVSVTRYKDWMRRVLAEHDDLAIPWKRLTSEDDLLTFYVQSGPAIIVKPVSGAASIGVRQIKSENELAAFCEEIDPLTISDFMVEKLIDSNRMYSIETLSVERSHHAITMSSSQMEGYPYNLTSHTIVPPRNLDDALRDRIAGVVRRFLDAIGLVNGVAHTEVKVDDDGLPYIIESQTRVGGDRIWRMVELTTKVLQIDLALRNLIEPVLLQSFPQTDSVAGFFCLLPPAGEVKAIASIDFLDNFDGVFEYCFNIKPGQILAPIKNNSERRGYVFMQAANHAKLFEQIGIIYEKLWIEYSDGTIWHPSFE